MLLLGLLAGCSLVDGLGTPGGEARPEMEESVQPYEARLALDYLELLERLAVSSPAGQAEIAQQARVSADLEPTTANRLRLALVLALPGHAGSDPLAARTELGALLAIPERLLPAELALARVSLQDVNARLALLSENRRLLAVAGQQDSERVQSLNRRLQAQAADNAQLRQELDAALAKLEAVADLERSLAERQASPKGRPP
jgi:hypothetical protein